MAFFENLVEFEKSEHANQLIAEVPNGLWSLFLGAGSSYGAKNRNGSHPPAGKELSRILKAELGIEEAADMALPMLSEIFRKRDATKFRTLLSKLYQDCMPGWQTTIAQFAWRSIYTTNIDDILSKVYSGIGTYQRANIRDFADRIPVSISPSTLSVVHLHGLITKENGGLVFSPDEYAKTSSKDYYALHSFAREQLDGRIIYIGTRLNEPDFDYYLQRRLDAEYDAPLSESILVDPAISRAESEFYEGRGIHCIRATGEQFFEWLNERTPERKVPVRLSGVVSEDKMNGKEKQAYGSFRDHFAELPLELASTFGTEYDDFFSGGSLSIHDLESKNDCLFTHTEEAMAKARECLSNSDSGSHAILIHGAGGGGKSSALRRIAYSLSKEASKVVYWHHGLGWPDSFQSVHRLLPGKFVLIVDNIHNYEHQLKSLLQTAKMLQKSVLVIGATRDRYEPRTSINLKSAVSDPKNYHSVDCNWLKDEDTLRLANHLKAKERLGIELRGKSIPEICEHFSNFSSKILLAAMLSAFKGKKHEDIVKDEYAEMSDAGKDIYRYAALAESRGESFELSLIARAIPLAATKIWNRVRNLDNSEDRHELKSIVFGFEKKGHKFLRTRHRVIAEALVKNQIMSTEAATMVESILNAIAPYCGVDSTRNRDVPYRLSKALLDQRWMIEELQIPKESVESLFTNAARHWNWNYHFWIQRATFELHSMRRFSVAWDYCEKALELEDRSPIPHLTKANICFHWSASQANYNEIADENFKEADRIVEDLYHSGVRDPLLFTIAIRGYFHHAQRFGRLVESKKAIEKWIARADEIATSYKMISFRSTATDLLYKISLQHSAGQELDVSAIDRFQF